MPRKTRRHGGRVAPPPSPQIIVPEPEYGETASEPDPVMTIVHMITQLSQEEKDKLYQEAYEHGDLREIQPEPNASAEYNQIALAISALSEDDFEDFSALLEGALNGGVYEGGRRKKQKKRKAKKTRKTRKLRKSRR